MIVKLTESDRSNEPFSPSNVSTAICPDGQPIPAERHCAIRASPSDSTNPPKRRHGLVHVERGVLRIDAVHAGRGARPGDALAPNDRPAGLHERSDPSVGGASASDGPSGARVNRVVGAARDGNTASVDTVTMATIPAAINILRIPSSFSPAPSGVRVDAEHVRCSETKSTAKGRTSRVHMAKQHARQPTYGAAVPACPAGTSPA